MAKKKKVDLSLVVTFAAIVLALAAFFLMFAPAASITDTDTTYTGINLTFGYKTENTESVIFAFSFMNLLTYILLLVGVVFGVLSMLGKLGKLSGFISAVCYLVAGIFFFCALAFSILGEDFDTLLGIGSILSGKEASKDLLSLGAGPIIAGVLAIISAVTMAVNTLVLSK